MNYRRPSNGPERADLRSREVVAERLRVEDAVDPHSVHHLAVGQGQRGGPIGLTVPETALEDPAVKPLEPALALLRVVSEPA